MCVCVCVCVCVSVCVCVCLCPWIIQLLTIYKRPHTSTSNQGFQSSKQPTLLPSNQPSNPLIISQSQQGTNTKRAAVACVVTLYCLYILFFVHMQCIKIFRNTFHHSFFFLSDFTRGMHLNSRDTQTVHFKVRKSPHQVYAVRLSVPNPQFLLICFVFDAAIDEYSFL